MDFLDGAPYGISSYDPELERELKLKWPNLDSPLPAYDIGQHPSRKIVPGLPRAQTFKRQNSERREPLTPSGGDAFQNLAAPDVATISPRETFADFPPDEITGLYGAIFEKSDGAAHAVAPIEKAFPVSIDTSIGEAVDEQLRNELETNWILHFSMHFKDKSAREKFFVTYAQTPTTWRKITVTCDYRNATPDSLEQDLKGPKNRHEKSAIIYEAIRDSLSDIQFYDTVTNLKLETREGRLHVHVTEDVNEIEDFPLTARTLTEDTGDTRIPKHPGYLGPTPEDLVIANSYWPGRQSYLWDPYQKLLPQAPVKPGLGRQSYIKGLVGLPRSTTLKRQEDEQRKSLTPVESTKKEPPKAPLVKLKQGLAGFANGANTAALADTGSRENIISASYAKELGLKVGGSSSLFKIGNSQRIQSLGKYRLSPIIV